MGKRRQFSKPELSNSHAQSELDKAEAQFDQFNDSVKDMTLDRMNAAPKAESEGHGLSQKEIDRSKDIYLKPERTVYATDIKTGKGQIFNEKFRKEYEFQKELVQFVAEHKELIGETIETWTRPFGGMPAEYWKVPSNKPVWGPRYLAEQIKRKCYHRLVMQETRASNLLGGDSMGQYYGSLAADTTIQRLDAHPVNQKRSLFMGASGF
jgi:hypothetical protein